MITKSRGAKCFRRGVGATVAMTVVWMTAGCSSSTGSVHAFRVGEDRYLYGPWKALDGDRDSGVRWDPNAGDDADTFAIVLDRGFLNYLSDSFNEAEPCVIFTFQEGGGDENRVVKVLPPARFFPDKTLFNQFSRFVYGPKRIESNVVEVHIQILELDVEESEDTKTFLNFLGNAAQTLALANPITAGEIKVAKEVANSLLANNRDDLVFDARFDLVPIDSDVTWSVLDGSSHQTIPLVPGRFALIKQETPNKVLRPFAATTSVVEKIRGDRGSYALNVGAFLLALPIDIVAIPLSSAATVFADVPDVPSRSMIVLDGVDKNARDGGDPLMQDDNTRALVRVTAHDDTGAPMETAPYMDKTWIAFTIEVGRDGSTWERRKALNTMETKLLEIVKRNESEPAFSLEMAESAVDELGQAFKIAERSLRGARSRGPQSRVRLLNDAVVGTIATRFTSDIPFILERPSSRRIIAARFERDDVREAVSLAVAESSADSPRLQELTLKAGALPSAGRWVLVLELEEDGGKRFAERVPVRVVELPAALEPTPKLGAEVSEGDSLVIGSEHWTQLVQRIDLKFGDGAWTEVGTGEVSRDKASGRLSVRIPKVGDGAKLSGIAIEFRYAGRKEFSSE